MTDTKTPTTRREFEGNLVAKAWRDADFKKRLLADPNTVVQEELAKLHPGAKLPAKLQVHVHSEGENEVHLVLPRNPREENHTVTDEDLDQVAGGTGVGVVVAVVAATVGNTGANVNQVVNGNINSNANVNLNVNMSVNATTTS